MWFLCYGQYIPMNTYIFTNLIFNVSINEAFDL